MVAAISDCGWPMDDFSTKPRLFLAASNGEPLPMTGQIWREVDERVHRFIRIEDDVPRPYFGVKVIEVYENSKQVWEPLPSARPFYVHIEQFGGKRPGFELLDRLTSSPKEPPGQTGR